MLNHAARPATSLEPWCGTEYSTVPTRDERIPRPTQPGGNSLCKNRMPGEHFTINKCADVPAFLESAGRELSHLGTLKAEIWDIEGAYPNCPKP